MQQITENRSDLFKAVQFVSGEDFESFNEISLKYLFGELSGHACAVRKKPDYILNNFRVSEAGEQHHSFCVKFVLFNYDLHFFGVVGCQISKHPESILKDLRRNSRLD